MKTPLCTIFGLLLILNTNGMMPNCPGAFKYNYSNGGCCVTNTVTLAIPGQTPSQFSQEICTVPGGAPWYTGSGGLVITPPTIWPPATNQIIPIPTNTVSRAVVTAYFTNELLDVTGSAVTATPAYWRTMFYDTLTESSTNLIQWQSYHTITGWVSDVSVLTILYRNGTAISTNLVLPQCVAGNSTNAIELPELTFVNTKRAEFFRVAP